MKDKANDQIIGSKVRYNREWALYRLFGYNKSWRRKAFRASVYSTLNKLFDIAPEILIGVAVDLVVKQEDSFLSSLGFDTATTQLTVLGICTLAIWMSESLFEYLYSIEWRRLAQNIQHQLRVDGFERAMNHDLQWFEREKSGNFQTTLGEDVNQLERFLDGGLNDLIQILVSTLLVSLVFFYLSPVIAAVALLPIPLILIVSIYFQKKLEPKYKAVRNAAALISSRLGSAFGGVMTIKAFLMEGQEVKNLSDLSRSYVDKNKDAIKLSSAFTPIIRLFVLVGFLFTLIHGGMLAFEGALEAGAYSALVFLTQRLLWPFTSLGQTFDLYQRAMASTNRIMNLVELEPVDEHATGVLEKIDQFKISFEKVCFSYDRMAALEDISFNIQQGEHIGICGATGSGKSTLIKLILGFYKPQSGIIKIDDQNISNIDIKVYRELFSFVGQDLFLFDGNLRENICYGNESYDEKLINQVLRKASLYNFVEQLEHGLETKVGEKGLRLSGGQRQRVAIARALLKNAPILLLDEATSSLDYETEAHIQKQIARNRHGKTVISVAHRLSSLRYSDRIIVIEDGKIDAVGDHQFLMENSVFYRKLWDFQNK